MTGIPLTRLAAGDAARVVGVPAGGGHRPARLAALGLLAGARLEIVQLRPEVIVRIGATALALERELADLILVRAEG